MEKEHIKKLIDRVLAGDRAAGNTLFKEFGEAIKKGVASVQSKGAVNECEDLFQDVCFLLMKDDWKVLRKCSHPESLGGFLWITARREALEKVRGEAKENSGRQFNVPVDSIKQLSDEAEDVAGCSEIEALDTLEAFSDMTNDEGILIEIFGGVPDLSHLHLSALALALTELDMDEKLFLQAICRRMSTETIMKLFTIQLEATFYSRKSKLLKKLRDRIGKLLKRSEYIHG
jgi:DNA-directed RNA polymerase specialized sigma24 family protein